MFANAPAPRVFRVAIVEDHLLQRQRTEQLVNGAEELRVVFSGETAPAFVAWLRQAPKSRHPHVLVLDLRVDRRPGVDAALVRRFLRAGLKIVVLSALSSPPLVRDVLAAGVRVIVGKRDSEADVLAAIRAAIRGEEWLTTELADVIADGPGRPRLSSQEKRALVLYASGLTVGEVATSMNVKPDTAKQYLERVKAKYTAAGFSARSKLDLSRIAWVDGYVEPVLQRLPPRAG